MGFSPIIKRWLLAEHVRCREELGGRVAHDAAANALAERQSDTFEGRLIDRAVVLTRESGVDEDLQRLKGIVQWVWLGLAFIAMTSASMAVVIATDQQTLDALSVLVTLLLLPTLTLILWLSWMMFQPSSLRASPIPRLLLGITQPLARSRLKGPDAECTLKAGLSLLETPMGRWVLALVIHGFWLVYLISALAFMTLQLSIRQYDVVWGTTILSEQSALALLHLLAWLPEKLGWLASGSEQWLLGGRLGLSPEAFRMEWGRFLLVVLLCYGVLPRLLAWTVAMLGWQIQSRRLRLDLTKPGYMRLKHVLMSDATDLPATLKGDLAWPEKPPRPANHAGEGLVGVTIELDEAPAATSEMFDHVTMLGASDNRQERAAVLAALKAMRRPAKAMVVQVQVTRTPDQGLVNLINDLADCSGGALIIVLMGDEHLASWVAYPEDRLSDWARLARATGAHLTLPSDYPKILDRVLG